MSAREGLTKTQLSEKRGGRQKCCRPTGFGGCPEKRETRASSLASLLVDPEAGEDDSFVRRAEIDFSIIALEPWLGGTEQRCYGPPDRPQLLSDTQVSLPLPLLLFLYRGRGEHVLVVLVKHGVADVLGAPPVLRPVCRNRARGTGILAGPYI